MRIYDDAVSVLKGLSMPLRDRFLSLLDTGPEAVLPTGPGSHITASALIVDPAGRVLLCLHKRLGCWAQLGGHCEPEDATLAGVALREATEESGIAGLRVSAAPISIAVLPVHCRFGVGDHFDVAYGVLAPANAVETCSSESNALGWFRPDALPTPLAPITGSLIGPALAWAAEADLDR